jgi:hypothetical protein
MAAGFDALPLLSAFKQLKKLYKNGRYVIVKYCGKQ